MYSFKGGSGDGANPIGVPIDVGKNLYGTTVGGGAYNSGTAYSVNRSTKLENWVYSFQNNTTDGGVPYSRLIRVGTTLYGTTSLGGTYGCGTVFSIGEAGGTDNVLYNFQGGTDGCEPMAGLTYANPYLYGTTSAGGPGNYGTVYSLDPANPTTERWSYALQGGSAGAQPGYAVLLHVGRNLYGTTVEGGNGTGCFGPCGTVFSISKTGTGFAVVHAFQGVPSDGYDPEGDLSDVNGTLYGTTVNGGSTLCGGGGCGTVFSLTP